MRMTRDDIKTIADQTVELMNLRGLPGDNPDGHFKKAVIVCRGTGCTSSRSDKIQERFETLIADAGKQDEIEVVRTGCFGLCEAGPVVIVHPGGTFYSHIEVDDADKIFNEHLIGEEPVKSLIYPDALSEEAILAYSEVPFTLHQRRIALRNCGHIDPERIEEYIAHDGYRALDKVLFSMTPDEVIETVTAAGLRGLGGGGFPTGRKWMFTKQAEGATKYVVCNADEGDPGAFMDRSILEGDPHTVIEAMIIAGYAIGAHQGFIYIRAEYPIAVQRLEIAIEQAKEKGLLGDDILGSGFNFNLELRLGAGAFVCGEETALIASIEGHRGMPRNKPPFPANAGLWGKPTLINNVETYANIPVILLEGAESFRQVGTENSPGTKVFALGGKIKNIGLVEVPMGTTLRQVVYDIGGGIPNDKAFKAVQTGGPSGGCIGADKLDTPIDFDSLKAIGSMMGSGGMIVMDEDNCMVDVARFYMDFITDESCGKCTPCREGTKRMLELLEKICDGKGEKGDIAKLESLAMTAQLASLCALGQTAANPVLSTLATFRDEYEAHIEKKSCPAGVCTSLISFFITEACIGCTKCARNCPVNCISGKVKERHVIDRDACIKCGNCQEVCPVNAVIRK
jgi:NADH:ubiquinone oxidoreductase subunit F (NADH-binding)/(2Fe-2S) ferredoxin/NAD-dependent dihydropyrimidine dehydrogenase PreA subunit